MSFRFWCHRFEIGPKDIPLLVHYFLSKFAKRLGRSVDVVSPETMEALRRYAWPGNIRELEHVIERAAILSPGKELQISLIELATQYEVASETIRDP